MSTFEKSVSAVTGGVVFGVALLALVDGLVVSHIDEDAPRHICLILCVPAVMATLGLALSLAASPRDTHSRIGNSRLIVCCAWVLYVLSTIGALIVTLIHYVGKQSHTHGAPGAALVLYCALVALSGSILWSARMELVQEEL